LYPAERLKYVAEDSGARFVISTRKLAASLNLETRELIAVEELTVGKPVIPHAPSADDALYIIYTSGSTGKPKGVKIPHGAAVNFLQSMIGKPGLSPSDVFLSVTTPSFDIWFLEIMGTLSAGGKIVLAESHDTGDGNRLLGLIRQHDVTVMQGTPLTWKLLIEAGWQGESIRVLCGGEAMSRELMRELLARGREVWNMYGPTETTVWSTCRKLEPSDDLPYIGTPIDNTEVYILDSALQPVPYGVTGDLYIGGAGLAIGYHNNSELTSKSFIPNPFGAGRIYRTGDLARFSSTGDLQCLGRIDNQVKIRGFRIEVEEIESAIQQYCNLAGVIVNPWKRDDADIRLVAYVTGEAGRSLSIDRIREVLASRLPYYMIPQHLVQLSEVPRTPNGKIDRKALPAPQESIRATDARPAEPESEDEIQLAAIWREMLGIESIRTDDSFFDLGGHSLLAMQMIAKVQQASNVALNPRSVLMNTLAQLAAEIGQLRTEAAASKSAKGAGVWQKIKNAFGR
jgi:amino acid adenylation domain-containing protein